MRLTADFSDWDEERSSPESLDAVRAMMRNTYVSLSEGDDGKFVVDVTIMGGSDSPMISGLTPLWAVVHEFADENTPPGLPWEDDQWDALERFADCLQTLADEVRMRVTKRDTAWQVMKRKAV